MQSRPPDLADAEIAAALCGGWDLASPTVAYLPVGYGSHHWSVRDGDGRRWFASVDVLAGADPDASFHHLNGALALAAAVRDAGLSFVVAPVPASDGSVLRRLAGTHAIALYPHVDGRPGGFHDALTPTEAAELTDMLCRLHATPPAGAAAHARVETFAIPDRGRLEAALADAAGPGGCEDGAAESGAAEPDIWPGPYGRRLRSLLAEHADDVATALRYHDQLVRDAGPQSGRLVLTHGEPHPGNLIRTPNGPALIDWDTALLAPPERDLWLLDARVEGQASAAYAAKTGHPVNRALLARYELAWSLTDLAAFVELLRHAPDTTADTAWSWEACHATLKDLPDLTRRLP